MPLLFPGFPPGPLDVEVPLLETAADRVLHSDPDCRALVSWALGNREFVEVPVNLGALFAGPSERFCGCTMSVLDEFQVRRLEVAATFEMLSEMVDAIDPTRYAPWVTLCRARAQLEDFVARLESRDEYLSDGSRVEDHRDVLEVLSEDFVRLSARLSELQAEALAAHPWEDQVGRWMANEVPAEGRSISAGTCYGLRNGVSYLDQALRPYDHRSRATLPLEAWSDPDVQAAEYRALGALTEKPKRAPYLSELALARLTSGLVESSVTRSTRAALQLAEYVVVAHNWRDDVLSDSPVTRTLSEVICRSETVSLPGGALALRVPGLLGHELWDANRRKGDHSFGNVYASLSFFKGNGVVVDLSEWRSTIEVALTLWMEAGGTVEVPADGSRYAGERLKRPGPDPSEGWSAAALLLGA